jgi:hypothetical protein
MTVATFLLRSGLAFAAAPPLQLTWRAPEGCPSGADVESQVADLLGAREIPPTRRLVAVTTIEKTERGSWTVRLETTQEGVTGQRVFEGDSCKTVAATTALILAFALDPDAAARTTPSRPLPIAPVEAKPPPTPDTATAPKPLEPVATSLHGALQIAALSGILPKPALAARAIVGVRHRPWGAEIVGQISDERDKVIDRTNAGGSFRLLSIGARIDWEPFRGPWTLRLSAGGELEHVIAKGFGVSRPTTDSANMPAALFALQLGWPLSSRLSVHLEGDLAARSDRARFVLSPTGSVFEVPVLGVSGATGVELTF